MSGLDENSKAQFIEFLLAQQALKTGDFTTKSGRKTPYFINFGSFFDGQSLSTLASFYNRYLIDAKLANASSVLFGPAYKGISLAVSCALELWRERSLSVRFCYNRKEAKTHGDKGDFVGYYPQPGEELIIIEDVITAGSTLAELIPALREELGVKIEHVVFAVDRCERGESRRRASTELSERYELHAHALVSAHDIFDFLQDKEPEICGAFADYLAEYGGE